MNVRPVTIAIPVYNGEPYFQESIESVLAQDFGDFDLLLCDNASTDGTWEICNSYAARDRRISCYRNEKNLGAIRNFELARQYSHSPFFKWHAHDDVLEPTFIGKCYRFLADNDSDYLACTSKVVFIDETGKQFLSEQLDTSLDATDPTERFKKFYGQGRNDYGFVYGLMRKETAERIPMRMVWGADWVFVVEMVIRGKIHQIQEPLMLFRIRINSPESYVKSTGPVALWAAPRNFYPFPHLRQSKAIISAITNSSMSDDEKRFAISLFRKDQPLSWVTWQDISHMISQLTAESPRLHRFLRNFKRRVQAFFSRR